jgi:long-chain acyl-CoA synthetase
LLERFEIAMTLLRRIVKNALRHPRRVIAVDDQRQYSYATVLAGACFVRSALKRHTDNPHIGLMLPTSGAFAIGLLACWLDRRVAVPLNYLLAPEELAYVIRDAGLDTIVTAQPLLDYIGEENIPDEITVLRLEDVSFKGLPRPAWPPKHREDELATLLYTSGTSAAPKGVMLTHGNLRANIEQSVEHAGLNSADAFLGVLPQFHSFGLTVLTILPLAISAKVIYTARFIPRKIIQLLRQHQPDIFVGIPSMYGALLSVKNAGPEDFASLRIAIAGGEPLPDAIHSQFLERYNVRILEGYGLTETSPVTHWSTPGAHKHHSVGRPVPRMRQFIVDEHDNILGPNEEGEILLAGPNIMKGYYKLPELTDQAIVHLTPPGESEPVRCFRTGDMGRIDDEGYLFITGRKKEMLIIGGENVFPREIEEVLNHHEMVHASAVIGQRDDMRGEVPIAFIEKEEDATIDEAALRTYCREHLAGYKVPRKIHCVDALPRSATGKILRRKLTDQLGQTNE